MELDSRVTFMEAERAAAALQRSGFETTATDITGRTKREVAWLLAPRSERRRRDVLEILRSVLRSV